MRYNIAKCVNGSWYYLSKNFVEYETLIKILSRRKNILDELSMNGNDTFSCLGEDGKYHKYLRKYMVWSDDRKVIDVRKFPEFKRYYAKAEFLSFLDDECVVGHVLRKKKKKNYSRKNNYRFRKKCVIFSFRDCREEEIYDEDGNVTGYERIYGYNTRKEIDDKQVKICSSSWKSSSKMKHQWEKHLDEHIDTTDIENFDCKEYSEDSTNEILDGFMNYYQNEENFELNIV